MKRKDAYRWLSEQMGLNEDETHIGMFDVPLCKLVVLVAKQENKNA